MLYMIPIYDIQFLLNNDLNDVQFTISDQLLLETLLIEIRGKTISYSAYKKKQSIIKEQTLIEEIRKLEEATNINQLDEKKTELENIRKEKMQGIM